MFVSRIKLKNWRNFTAVDVPLRDIVYLIGPNASGKSNFLDAFRFLRDVVNPQGGGLQQAVLARGGLKKVRSLAARRDPRIEFEIELRESLDDDSTPADWRYFLSLRGESSGTRRVLVDKEEVYKSGRRVMTRPDADDAADKERRTQTHLEQVNMNQEFRDISDFLREILYLHLVPQLLRYGSQISTGGIESDPFGQRFLEEIASTTKRTRGSRLRRIETILKKAIPHLEELRFVKDEVKGTPHLEMRYIHWRAQGAWHREDQFSDGTLRLIALTWTLLASNTLILLEEPELSLHTRIVEQIPAMILNARRSRKMAGGQILVSTHSESLLSRDDIDGGFLILRPGEKGESTTIESPDEAEIDALQAGMSPADILLPKTAASIGKI
jgi:predicted ATPase